MSTLTDFRTAWQTAGAKAAAVVEPYIAALDDAKPSGTLKAWMTAHHGQHVTTLQVCDDGTGAWAPIGRRIDAHSAAGAVFLADSRRDYAGSRVVATTDRSIAVAFPFQLAIYAIED